MKADVYKATQHFASLYETAPAEYSFARSSGDFPAWRNGLRQRVRQTLGLDTMAHDLRDHRVCAELRGEERVDELLRQEWVVWTEPTVPLPVYVLKRADADGRLPVVLTPHGHNRPHIYAGIWHTDEEREHMISGERDIAVQAAREGYLAVAPTTRAFGETRTEEDIENDTLSSCGIALKHALLVGRTPIGERVWDMMRLIDWLTGRDDADTGRVAITGNSGGGTVSLWAAAMDERIGVSVPSCYFCTFVGSIGSIRHCDCNYVPGMLRMGEMYDIAGLTAPRPFRAIAGRDDPIFPLAHVEAAFARLQEIYAAAGAPKRCELYIGEGGHRYYADGAWPFMRTWL
ncbi:MAG: hypothetical protein GF331_23275 [Chitinivibrionales bacterium]|nr:hypothetical protein [Chitinivibrionales bacterium]